MNAELMLEKERFSFACEVLDAAARYDDVVDGIQATWQRYDDPDSGMDMISPETLFRLGFVNILMIDYFYRFLDTPGREGWCDTALKRLQLDTEAVSTLYPDAQTHVAIGVNLIESAKQNIDTNFGDAIIDHLPLAQAVDDDLAGPMGIYIAATTMVVVIPPQQRKQAAKGALVMAREAILLDLN